MSDLTFAAVERYVAVTHPDPDGDRQHQATRHGSTVAAPWLAILLDVSARQIATWRAQGTLDVFEADRIATELGQYATAIWPGWQLTEDGTEVEQLDFADPSFWQKLAS